MKVFDGFKFKEPQHLKNSKKSRKMLGWTIYGDTREDVFAKKFAFFHYFLKYRIIVPILSTIHWIVDKKMGKFNISEDFYNRNIRIFNDCYKKSKQIWVDKWGKETSYKTATPEYCRNAYKRSIELMDTVFEGYMRLCLQDTAYREFHNILMHTIAQQMLEEYKDRKKYHVFYTSKEINDMQWLATSLAVEHPDVEIKVKKNKFYAKRL